MMMRVYRKGLIGVAADTFTHFCGIHVLGAYLLSFASAQEYCAARGGRTEGLICTVAMS